MIQAIVISSIFFIVSCIFQAQGIYGGDSGDLVTAAVTAGVPHPPGYPLYTALGWLLSHVPVLTPVWRVTLVSSLSHAIVLYVVYLLTYRVLHKHLPALFAVFVLAGNYLFMLYSLTPEVFGLLDLFVISLLYLLYLFVTTKKPHVLVWTAGIFGLSLTHHPIIVFLIPAWMYVAIRFRIDTLLPTRTRLQAVAAFLLGLLPYVYIPIAAHGESIVNWDRAVSVSQFIKLIMRADYGTFMSSAASGTAMFQRFLNLQAYADFFLLDFSYIGIVLLVAGSVWLFFRNREFFIAWMLSLLFLGPGFYFYASFPLGGRFTLGTYERFMLSSYVVVAPVIGIGLYAAIEWLIRHLPAVHTKSRAQIIQIILVAAFLYPVMIGAVSAWRFIGLTQDKTAENFAQDILASSPPRSIVLLVHDISLFSTQYVRYGLRMRPDTIVIQFSRLQQPDYQEVLKRLFPDLIIPEDSASFINEFIQKNNVNHPIVSNSLLPLQDDVEWVPHGFLYLLIPSANSPEASEVLETNAALWNGFHNPTAGILGHYRHLMLSNVLDEYASASVIYGEILGQSGRLEEAKEQFTRAVSYGSDGASEDAYMKLGMTQALLKDCNGALQSLEQSKPFATTPNMEVIKYEAIIYRDCVGDQKRASELFSAYDASKKKTETPLDQL